MAWPCLPDERLDDIADGIDRLAGRPAGHQRPPATHGPSASSAWAGEPSLEEAFDRGQDLLRLGHPAGADLAAGHVADAGADPDDAAAIPASPCCAGSPACDHI